MKLSLRKANAIQLLINEQINEPFTDSAEVGKFDDPADIIPAATDKLSETVGKKFDLIDVYYVIREKVRSKSHEAGIGTLLTALARNQREAAALKQLNATKNFAPKPEVLAKALEDIRKPENSNVYSRKDAVIVGLFSKETIEGFAKSLKLLQKEKQKISDKLLHLNVSSEIELDEKEVTVLNKYELL
jgi:hypothetical protein